jgi:putative endonuclease
MPKIYYVYILASQRRVLYIGFTSQIEQRVFQHKTHAFRGFTAKYNVTSLVYLGTPWLSTDRNPSRERNESMA